MLAESAQTLGEGDRRDTFGESAVFRLERFLTRNNEVRPNS